MLFNFLVVIPRGLNDPEESDPIQEGSSRGLNIKCHPEGFARGISSVEKMRRFLIVPLPKAQGFATARNDTFFVTPSVSEGSAPSMRRGIPRR